MKTVVKKFDELTNDELFEIFKLRSEVFVVEQKCIYLDIDNADKKAYHIFIKDGDSIEAYLRLLDKDDYFDEVGIGRVISRQRGKGFGKLILEAGKLAAKEKLNADRVKVAAQTYAKGFYEKQGFVQTSEEFLEDGIPHIEMIHYYGENNE